MLALSHLVFSFPLTTFPVNWIRSVGAGGGGPYGRREKRKLHQRCISIQSGVQGVPAHRVLSVYLVICMRVFHISIDRSELQIVHLRDNSTHYARTSTVGWRLDMSPERADLLMKWFSRFAEDSRTSYSSCTVLMPLPRFVYV